jgi:glycosyltransferase involved in cell wall biosynthesis
MGSTDNHTPKISVIMPAYNAAPFIAAALDSVLQQTFQDFEIVVVNDGSPDTAELEKVLQPYLARIVYMKQENKRAAGARNTAIRQAKGEFLAFLDSDDSWFPDHLASQMKLFADDPTLDLVYCNCLALGDPKRPHEWMDRCPSHGPATFAALVVERCQIPISAVVARKVALVKAGLFDESLARCDDYDMWLRTAFHGAKIGYSRRVQARVNDGRPGSLGASVVRMVEAYWKILEKADQTLPLSDTDREIVQMRSAEIHARYLIEEAKVQLSEGQFDKAKALFSEANAHLRRPKVSLLLLGLQISPRATRKIISFAQRILGGSGLAAQG